MNSSSVTSNPKKIISRKVRIVNPYPITHHFKPDIEFVGKTLLELLTNKFPFNTELVWRERIREGRVYLENRDCSYNTLLEQKDEIRHHNPSVIEPSVPNEVEILHESEEFLAVFKPSPLPMHPGGRYNKNSLTWMLQEIGFKHLKITHRLDAVTSGIVLFAKNKPFSKKVMEAFSSGNVEKEYHALIVGVPLENKKTIESKIRRKKGFVFESGLHLDTGQDAITHFEVIKTYDSTSLVKCRPVTGRTHQIRLHLAEWGFPIIDDPIYGINGDRSSKKTQNKGIALLSSKLTIESLHIHLSLNEHQVFEHLVR